MVCRRRAIRHRVCPKSLRRCGHSGQQNPPATQSAEETTSSAPPPTASQRDAVLQLATLDRGLRRLDDSSKLRQGRNSQDEIGVLEDDRCIGTGVSQQRHLVNELVLACSPPPPPRPQISYTILSQADWCAVRAAARCELGLLAVVKKHGIGSARELVTIGARDAALHCAMRFREGLQQVRRALLGAPVPASLNPCQPTGHSVRTCAAVCLAPTSLSPQQPFDSNQALVRDLVCVLFFGVQQVTEKEEQLDSRCILPHGHRLRWRTGIRASLATAPTRRWTRRRRHTILTAFSPAGDHLPAQPVRRCLSPSAVPPGESSVQNGLAWSTSNCSHRMRDPLDSRNRRLRRRTTHLTGSAHRRISPCSQWIERFSSQEQAPRFGSSDRADIPCSGQTAESDLMEVGPGCGWKLLPTTAPDRCFSRRHNSHHGSFSESLSSLTARPILDVPSVEVPSPNLSGLSLRKVAHTECVLFMVQATLNRWLAHAQQKISILCVTGNISGVSINLTLIPTRATLTPSVPAAFWLSLHPQPVRGSNVREKEEERSGHAPRHQGVTEPEVDSPWAYVQNGDGPRGKNRPYLPWFLICFLTDVRAMATSPTGRACRAIYAGRIGCGCEIAKSEWAVYPSQKSPLVGGAVSCGHLGPGERSTARRALPAFGGLVPWYRCAGRVGGPCSGHTDSICDSEPEHWEWDLDVAGDYYPRVLAPPLPLQLPAANLSVRAHQPSLPVSASLVRTRRSPQSPTRAVVLLLNAV